MLSMVLDKVDGLGNVFIFINNICKNSEEGATLVVTNNYEPGIGIRYLQMQFKRKNRD